MTLAISAAPLNSERRGTSVSGTRAVVSSQQLMGASKIKLNFESSAGTSCLLSCHCIELSCHCIEHFGQQRLANLARQRRTELQTYRPNELADLRKANLH